MNNKRWTEEEDKIVLDFISKHPENIKEACELAAKKLSNRTALGVYNRYYCYLKNLPTNKSFFVVSRKKATINQKNVAKGKKINSIPTFKSKWKRILAILTE